MSTETQIREALSAEAVRVESSELHPYERVAGAVARTRRKRRAAGAASLAVVAALAVGVPAATGQWGDRTSAVPAGQSKLPPANDRVWDSISTWPTRGDLASDRDLVATVDDKFSGRTIFLEDVASVRVALVVRGDDLIVATAPVDAPADLSITSDGPVSGFPDRVISMNSDDRLVILTTPDEPSAEISRIPQIARNGTVSRAWAPLALTSGVGRATSTPLTQIRAAGYVGAPHLGFGPGSDAMVDCTVNRCDLDPAATQERDTNNFVARRLSLDPAQLDTETVFNGGVPSDFGNPGLQTANPQDAVLHVLHTTLPGGQVLRTAWLRNGQQLHGIEQARPLDAQRAMTVPLLVFGAGKSQEGPTTVHVFVSSGVAVRAVSDSEHWPSSQVVPLKDHVATFELAVSPAAFDENYRLEVLDGAGKVLNTIRTAQPTGDLLEGTS